MIDRTYHLARRGSQQFDVQPSATNVLLLDELLDRTRDTASDAASVSKHSFCVRERERERESEREHALGIALVRLGLVESCLPGFVGFDIADAADMLEHRKRSNPGFSASNRSRASKRARERETALQWWRTSICSGAHLSRLVDLTLEMCVPRLRWMPEHRMQMKTPILVLAQRGPTRCAHERVSVSDVDLTTALE